MYTVMGTPLLYNSMTSGPSSEGVLGGASLLHKVVS